MMRSLWRESCARFVFFSMVLLGTCAQQDSWQSGIKPRGSVDIRQLHIKSFPASNDLSPSESFRLLARGQNHVIIGGENAMYKLSTADLSEVSKERIEWRSESSLMSTCQSRGKSQSECHNYIRIFSRAGSDTVKLCGTNSYQPQCQLFKLLENGTKPEPGSTSAADALCPFSPNELSTFVEADGQLYSGSTFRSGSSKTLIYRDPLSTDQTNFHQLNEAEFVESFEYKDYVYFFFREMSTEEGVNGKTVLSRVGRVCKNDRGWSESRWTTFVKARLACKIPGYFSFYLNMLHSVYRVRSALFSSHPGKEQDVVYGVFGTQPNSIAGHAVCAFRMEDIEEAFRGGYRSTDAQPAEPTPVGSQSSNWTVGSCITNSSDQLNAEQVSYVLRHSLAAEEVSSVLGRPLVASTATNGGGGYRFRQVAVVPGVTALDKSHYDVMYLTTDDGQLLKAVVSVRNTTAPVFSSHVVWQSSNVTQGRITSLLPVPSSTSSAAHSRRLLVVSDSQVISLNLAFNWSNLDLESRCTGCLALSDPEYGWDVSSRRCVYLSGVKKQHGILQNVTHGSHPMCRAVDRHSATITAPSTYFYTGKCKCSGSSSKTTDRRVNADARRPRSEKTYPSTNVDGSTTPLSPGPSTMAQRDLHCNRSSATLATAITCTSLLTLIIGVTIGWLLAYLFSKRQNTDRKLDRNSTDSYANSSWVADTLLRLCGSGTVSSVENTKPAQSNKTENVIYNKATLCENNIAKDVNIHIERQNLELSKNIKTPSTGSASPHKVRKVYI